MKDMTDGKLQEALEYAEKIGDSSLKGCLERIKEVDKNVGINMKMTVESHIYNDFAPYSFEFVRCAYKNGPDYKPDFISNGGIIFHGEHDGFGSGKAPTFSVAITPTKGWQIHT